MFHADRLTLLVLLVVRIFENQILTNAMSPCGIGSLANTDWGTFTPLGRSVGLWRVELLTADNFDLENKTIKERIKLMIEEVLLYTLSHLYISLIQFQSFSMSKLFTAQLNFPLSFPWLWRHYFSLMFPWPVEITVGFFITIFFFTFFTKQNSVQIALPKINRIWAFRSIWMEPFPKITQTTVGKPL